MTTLQKKTHVPKFGDWDSENISYTACFENARKDGVKRNPNDPEENPVAFKAMLDFQAAQPPYNGMSSSSTSRTLTNPKADQTEGDAGHGAHRRKTSVGSRKSNTSESGSERSNSDYSLLQQQQSRHRRERSDRRKSSLASSGTGSDHSSMSHSQSKPKSTTSSHHSHSDLLGHDTHTRVASIPKFGDWDEKDPHSGEGFTYIFEQVKEEKKTASQFPSMPQQQPVNHLNSANKRGKSSSNSKSKEQTTNIYVLLFFRSVGAVYFEVKGSDMDMALLWVYFEVKGRRKV
ncbi:unnamed protein product [Prunus armeniaca]|uniref:RIN4 pathogenic type III effector avirulence factor Avr cleavage site domain-containing protein n=1 Tax=Prunus armeniaca TaxID=36596 RepID=A0A6J5X565_PRUAR|nr:unnamed protein product [Prunus armeniaca]